MPFTPINTTEIETGKPVATTTQTKIKENFDYLNQAIEDNDISGIALPPITFRVNGVYPVKNGVLKTTLNHDLTITGVRILVDVAGSAGTIEIDLKVKRGGGSYTSIFTTKPSVAFGAGNDALSSNAVLDGAEVDLEAGDILRLDITSKQTQGSGFLVRVDYEAAGA